MDNNFSWGLEVDYIAHYGVPHGHGPNGGSGRYPWGSGAKWGKTPLGRGIDRVKGFFKKKKPATSNIETSEAKREVSAETKTEITANEFNSKHKDILENDFQKYKLDSDYQDRMNKAADLGLKALSKISYDDIDPNNDADKQWFLFEDQTVGLPQIADMALRGKSKDEIEAAINDAQKVNRDGRYTSKVGPLAYSGNPTKFIDEVIRIRDSQKSAESHEADRKAALESGDRNQILKYFQESSNEELTRAITKAGIMDSLNKSISDAKPKTVNPEETSKAQKETYIREALSSGDINRILSVAMEPSVSNNDLTNAINKMNTMDNLKEKAEGPTKLEKAVATVDKIKAGLDKTLGYYDTASKVWNTVAGNYNASNSVKTGQSKPLGYLMPTPNLKQDNNQKKDGNNQKQQKDQKPDDRDRNLQNQITDLKKLIEDSVRQKGVELEKTKTQNQPPKQQSQQVKNEVKSAVQKVSNAKIDAYEKYATSLFPNDDNGAVTSKKTDTLKSYYSYLSSQEIPKWQTISQSSIDNYDGYNYLDDLD